MTVHEWDPLPGDMRMEACAKCGAWSFPPLANADGTVRRQLVLIREGELSLWVCPETCEETSEKVLALEVQTS